MLGIIDLHGDKEFVTRAFHILEYNFDGQAVKFQFGIANPDYPAVVHRKQFVLDLDAYCHGSLQEHEVQDALRSSHEKLQKIFEESITAKARELMKQKND